MVLLGSGTYKQNMPKQWGMYLLLRDTGYRRDGSTLFPKRAIKKSSTGDSGLEVSLGGRVRVCQAEEAEEEMTVKGPEA